MDRKKSKPLLLRAIYNLSLFPIRWRRLSFRSLLIIIFVIQISGAVGLTGYISFYHGHKAVTYLMAQWRREIIARIQQKLDTYLKYPLRINQTNARAIREGYLNMDLNVADPRRDFYFWQQLQLFETVSWIGFGSQANGEYFTITRTPPNLPAEQKSLQIAIANQANQQKLSYYTINHSGQRDKLFTVYPSFDARTRPWYQAAVKAGKPIWHIYSGFFTPHLAYISASQPVYDKTHQLLGVASVDFDLNDLSLFLSNLRINQQGQIFIIDRAGLMVAPSTQEAIFSYHNGIQQRLQALKSRDPLTRLAVQQLLLNFNELQSITTIRELVFSTEQPYFLQVMPLAQDFDLDWLLVVVIPQAAFMAQIYTQTQTTLLLLCLALGIAIVIGWLTAHWIARPILRLNQVARKLARGQWDLPVKITREDEIGELTCSFNEMARQLKKSYERLLNDNITLEIRVAERTHELSQALDQLKSTQTQLIIQEKMASLGILMAGIAHEIKNPLNFINNFAVLSIEFAQELHNSLTVPPTDLNHTINDEIAAILQELQNNAQRIYEEGKRADSIVQNMLRHSRSNGSHPQLTDINLLVKEAAHLTYHSMRSQNERFCVQIIMECDEQLPPIPVMPQELRQVLINIINNAYYAMQAKQQVAGKVYNPQLLLQTQAQGEWVEIRINDNGIGIPETIKNQIFNPFFTTKPAGQGTGLGLSISYEIIVQGHQGTLEVETEVGQYTLFTVRLPKH
jgi:signal transduction histidine kinase